MGKTVVTSRAIEPGLEQCLDAFGLAALNIAIVAGHRSSILESLRLISDSESERETLAKAALVTAMRMDGVFMDIA